jgi:DNA-binding CsgD family transcriptional regulator
MSGTQTDLWAFAGPDLSALTPAERDAYEAVRGGEYGPREYARQTNRSPGTISNLLARADKKLEGSR